MKEIKHLAAMVLVIGISWLIFYGAAEVAYGLTTAIVKANWA